MKVKLTTTAMLYSVEDAEKLKTLGFTFKEAPKSNISFSVPYPMCRVEDSIDYEFHSVNELMEFAEKWGGLAITNGRIEIYDSYKE